MEVNFQSKLQTLMEIPKFNHNILSLFILTSEKKKSYMYITNIHDTQFSLCTQHTSH